MNSLICSLELLVTTRTGGILITEQLFLLLDMDETKETLVGRDSSGVGIKVVKTGGGSLVSSKFSGTVSPGYSSSPFISELDERFIRSLERLYRQI